MRTQIARVFLALSSLALLFGGVMHGLAFVRKAGPTLDGSALPAFFVNELKVLWLGDSTTLIGVGVVYAAVALMPKMASGSVLLLITSIPAATMLLLYAFLGGFYAAHLLAAATAMAFAAGLLLIAEVPRLSAPVTQG